MITPELVSYIQKQLREGKPKEEILSALRRQGWSETDLAEALRGLDLPSVPTPNISPPPLSAVAQSPLRGADFDDDLTAEETTQIYGKGAASTRFLDRKLFLIILLALGVSLIAGSAAAYLYYSQSPDRILAQMMEKSAQVKSERYSGQADLELEVSGNSLLNSFLGGATPESSPSVSPLSTKITLGLTTEFEMAADLKEPDHPRYLFTFNLVNKDQPAESRKPFFGLEMRGLDQIVYLKVSELIGLEQNTPGLVGQWIKIDPEALKGQLKQMGLEAELKEVEARSGQSELTPEKIEKINQLVREIKPLKLTRRLAGEKIDGQKTHHFQYVVDKESLRKFLLETNKIMGVQELTAEEAAEFDQFLNGLEKIEGEIWIGQKDRLPHKLTLNLVVRGEEKETKFAGRLQATVFLKDFNQSIDVQAPTQTKSLEEALGLIFQGLLGGAKTAADCAQKTASEKDQCYFDVALASQERDSCQLIGSLAKKNDCYYALAKAGVNSLVCEEIKGTASQGWKDECYRAVAEIKPDASLCQKVINLDWRNYCLAGAAKNAAFCSAVKKASTKSACQALFEKVP